MKKAKLILSIFLTQFNLFLFAQTIEVSDQPHQHVEINNVLFLENEKWLLVGSGDSGNENELYLKTVDSSTKVSTFNNSNSVPERIIEKVETQGNFGYALNTIAGQKYISRFSINSSSILFQNSSPIASDLIVNNFKILPNGFLVVVGYRMVDNQSKAFFKVINNNMSVAFSDYSMTGYYSDVVVFPDSTFMLTGGFGENPIFGGRKYNTYYEQVGDILEDMESEQIFPIENSEYFFLKDQTITKLDSNFQMENYVDLSNYGLMIDMEVDDENIFLLYQKSGEPPMILRLNYSLEVEDSFFVEDENFRAKSIDVSESELGVGGYLIPTIPFNNTPFLYPSTTAFFKTYTKDGMSDAGEFDLEIIEVRIEDYEKNDSCGAPDAYLMNLKNIKMTLINRGTKSINRAEFFVEVKGVKECNSGQNTPKYHIQRDELEVVHLNPGDTLRWRISSFEFPQNVNVSTEVELCIWLTTIENQRDIKSDDNYFCGEVLLNKGYVEEPIVFPTKGQFFIYPNPLDEIMKVSLLRAPFEPTVIEFYDYLGRKMEQKYFIAPRAQYKEFDISQLSSGVYFMKLSNEIIEEVVRVVVH